MPEFEDNTDTSKSTPYTYEPSKSTASELAGSVITPSRSSSQPSKSRWGKSGSASTVTSRDAVPAGEVDIKNARNLTDSLSSKLVPTENYEEKVRSKSEDRQHSQSRKSTSSSSNDEKEKFSSEDGEGKSSSRRRRSRSRSTSTSSPKPVEEVESSEDKETFADKIVNWIRKLVTGGKIEQEPEPQPRSRSRGRNSSGNGRRRRNSRNHSTKNGETKNHTSSGTSADGEKSSRRRRGSGSRSRKSSSS